MRRFRAAKRRVCGVDRKRKVFCSGLPKEILKTASIRPLSGRSKSVAKTASEAGLEISEFGFRRKTTGKCLESLRAFLIGNTPRLPHRSKEEGFLHTLTERNFENGADGAAFWAAKVRCRNLPGNFVKFLSFSRKMRSKDASSYLDSFFADERRVCAVYQKRTAFWRGLPQEKN